jgi:hypothetical protein
MGAEPIVVSGMKEIMLIISYILRDAGLSTTSLGISASGALPVGGVLTNGRAGGKPGMLIGNALGGGGGGG